MSITSAIEGIIWILWRIEKFYAEELAEDDDIFTDFQMVIGTLEDIHKKLGDKKDE